MSVTYWNFFFVKFSYHLFDQLQPYRFTLLDQGDNFFSRTLFSPADCNNSLLELPSIKVYSTFGWFVCLQVRKIYIYVWIWVCVLNCLEFHPTGFHLAWVYLDSSNHPNIDFTSKPLVKCWQTMFQRVYIWLIVNISPYIGLLATKPTYKGLTSIYLLPKHWAYFFFFFLFNFERAYLFHPC